MLFHLELILGCYSVCLVPRKCKGKENREELKVICCHGLNLFICC